ncbi:MAG TPA: class I SAM-dependent methyltransferase [Pyrinomonadaceae bacterium]|nr:class I SAM-dependent methyltransferase [Pyrinomonadaceae bacterium]
MSLEREQPCVTNDELTNVAGDGEARALERTGASPEAIISHYDKGEDFFKLVLGPELIYSCALFEGDDDLVEAQRRKLDYHIETANAANAKRVLDIGCGWGAMLRRLVDHAKVPHVVGLPRSDRRRR